MVRKNKNSPSVVFENKGLEVSNLGKRFKNRPILRGININVKKGEIVGLLGPNGAGKTTCFYSIMGLIAPDFGKIRFNGTDITNYPVHLRAKVGIYGINKISPLKLDIIKETNSVGIEVVKTKL